MMEHPNKPARTRLLYALALTTAIGLIALPATRWIVHKQAMIELPCYTPQPDDSPVRRVLAEHPRDFQLQLGGTLTGNPASNEQPAAFYQRNLEDLARRFPDEPCVYANMLRYMTLGPVRLHRDEEILYLGQTPIHDAAHPNQSTPPDLLKVFLDAAEHGERLEPNNAFFPYMASLALFEIHRDDEALMELQRAGEKSDYNDYPFDQQVAADRLLTEANGEMGAVNRIARSAATLFPHLSTMRANARLAMYFACEAERTGRLEDGIAIRHALMRYGGLMRAQSRTYIGSMVGIAISRIATARPGGVQSTPLADNLTTAQRNQSSQARQEAYYAFLARTGHAAEAGYARSEIAAGEAAKAACGDLKRVAPFSVSSFGSLGLSWALDGAVLSNILALLLFGIAAYGARLFRPTKRLTAIRGLFVCVVAGSIALWQWKVFSAESQPSLLLLSLMDDMTGNSNTALQPDADTRNRILGITATLIALAVPLLLVLIASILSYRSRVPISTGVGRALRGTAFPIAAVLVFVYALMLVPTLRKEARLAYSVSRVAQHEGRYYAELNGREWPGIVP